MSEERFIKPYIEKLKKSYLFISHFYQFIFQKCFLDIYLKCINKIS